MSTEEKNGEKTQKTVSFKKKEEEEKCELQLITESTNTEIYSPVTPVYLVRTCKD